MGRKKKFVEPFEVVENHEEPQAPEEVEASIKPCPDLDRFDIDGAIKTRSIERVTEALTDVDRVLGELETELADVKADLGKRVRVVKARKADLIHELESLTHDWVCDHDAGLAYLVHLDRKADLLAAIDDKNEQAINAISKRTRPLAPEDKQEAIPFGETGS